MALLKGWRYIAFVGGIFSVTGLALYPIIIDPMLHTDYYKEIQKETRKGIRQEDIQPGNMRVWTDPFDRNKSK